MLNDVSHVFLVAQKTEFCETIKTDIVENLMLILSYRFIPSRDVSVIALKCHMLILALLI